MGRGDNFNNFNNMQAKHWCGPMTSYVFKAQRCVSCDVCVCNGTAVGHTCLLNRSGVCDGIICYNLFLSIQLF